MAPNDSEIEPTPGVFRRDTWLAQAETPAVIEQFIKTYEYTEKHFDYVAKKAREMILEAKTKLFKEGLEANVTCRAKSAKSLKEKLKMRHEEKNYQYEKDIWDDIHDLAGVRVILYMPSEDQRDKVREIIQSIWGDNIEAKLHEGSREDGASDRDERQPSPKKKYRRRHLGYQAVHYRVSMQTAKTTPSGDGPWKERDRVEIQVVSALGHAWAEAGHEVLYKSYAYGAPPVQEERILDSLNGLVLSGDLLLEQFHELVMKRTYTRWTHLNELGSFLHDADLLQSRHDDQNKFRTDGLDVVFRFLQLTDQHYPLAVRSALREMGFPDQPKLDDMLATFKPPFEPASGMLASVCLVRHMMPQGAPYEARAVAGGAKECRIMISALTLLQNSLGLPELANEFLRANYYPDMSPEERVSLDFVLTDGSRQTALDEKHRNHTHHQGVIKPNLKGAWSWFQRQAKDEASICGLFFRLADMGATNMEDLITLLSQLSIGSLSTSSTPSSDDEA
ncbi:hypothetical protein K505DRAFT_57706 [Melanomma pulvis-pyrius CBS 109.77]|uniref:RelA/SpoT domain-containing protein n=1 Tax=Melanomma pulvis-pyrius CBS 109.77 TaxID=1314802 RepID=A0A6A6X770_9PLEO|nr:hypothetical protein K505DRAFT_57706 [Melanomma pulvis-pyrius CBS 109.77]